MALEVAIIADDITGALDSAAPFATRGMKVAAAPDIDACDASAIADCEVFAINTETRALASEGAQREVRRAWKKLAAFEPRLVFKKIDSRLKGNVGDEVRALMTASGRAHAIIAPAIPDMGRFVIAGAVAGFGIDAPLPIGKHIALDRAVTAPDCSDAQALDNVAKGLLHNARTHLGVGAAGLAASIAGLPRPASPLPTESAHRGPLLILAGSRDPITLEQLARLEHSDLRPSAFVVGAAEIDPQAMTGARVIILRAPPETVASQSDIARALARAALRLIEQSRVETILATGGDTASALVREAGIRTLCVDGAFALGVPTAKIAINARPMRLITKSGGFGGPHMLVDIARRYAAPL
ncbi:MAG TPA: four-carbon acid sugar kinase family protein [Caulobacterales bacterium]|nr:four-carbon acid sugar kinase family protein [Caulobacterales bacterium]